MNDQLQRAALSASARELAPTLPVFSAHLDLIRGTAALVVMLGHLRFMLEDLGRSPLRKVAAPPPVSYGTSNLTTPPHEAVIVFFVLSGLLVGGSVLRSFTHENFRWWTYAVNRLSRLLAVLVPALLLGALIDVGSRYLLLHGHVNYGRLQDVPFHSSLRTFLANLFFLQVLARTKVAAFGSNSVLWSLSAEFWYYALFPLLVSAVLTRGVLRRVAMIAAFALLVVALWPPPSSYFPLWALGAGITLLPLVLPRRLQRLLMCLALLQFLVVALLVWKHPFGSRSIDDTLLALSVALLLYTVLHRQDLQRRHSYANFAQHISQISFSLYLFHYPILLLLVLSLATWQPTLVRHHAATFCLIAPVTYAACYLLYLAFERNTPVVRRSMMAILHRAQRSFGSPARNPETTVSA